MNRMLFVFLTAMLLLVQGCEEEFGERVFENGETCVVRLDRAGLLRQTLGGVIWEVEHLKVIGSLNGDDLAEVRSMEECGKLLTLDLTEAQFAEGGSEPIEDTEAIGEGLFRRTKLLVIALPAHITRIGREAFSESSLQEIHIPESVTEIGDRAFSSCRSLEKIDLPAGVKQMGDGVFNGCRSLSGRFVFPAGLVRIEDNMLRYTSVSQVDLPDRLKEIGDNVFSNSLLHAVDLPESVERIGGDAFFGCPELSEVQISSGLEEILGKTNPFQSCPKLEKITVAPENRHFKNIGGLLYSKDGTELVAYPAQTPDEVFVMPAGVKRVYESAFSGVQRLRTLRIGGHVENPEDGVKGDCPSLRNVQVYSGNFSLWYMNNKLERLYFGENVNTQGSFWIAYMLWKQEQLKEFYWENPAPEAVDALADSGTPANPQCTLHVPVGSTAAYKAAGFAPYCSQIVETDLKSVDFGKL